jgi:hypothetical protein
MKAEQYWVYEDKVTKRAMVHAAGCHCIKVHGGGDPEQIKWLSFKTSEAAFQRAKATGFEKWRGCKHCEMFSISAATASAYYHEKYSV